MALLALVMEGNDLARLVYTQEEALNLVRSKVKTYEQFNKQFPGYGGYLPWVAIKNGSIEPTWDFKTRTPALDNGQLFWAALALSSAWEANHPNLEPTLREEWSNITWRLMLKNARKIFYNETTKKIRAVANIRDISQPPSNNSYSNPDEYYLDDPYEGELFCMILTLLDKNFTSDEISGIWVDKRRKLQAVNFHIQSINKTITAERGWWFSAHEQWKNLFMPYNISKTYWGIFENNEKVRTWNSREKGINGLYASTTGTANSNDDKLDYFADCGVREVSFQEVKHL